MRVVARFFERKIYNIIPDSTTQSVNDANLNGRRDKRICNYSFHFECDSKQERTKGFVIIIFVFEKYEK